MFASFCFFPQVTQLGDKQFRLALEDCLAFGKPMLIENIEEELDPVLDPVLERRLVWQLAGAGQHSMVATLQPWKLGFIKASSWGSTVVWFRVVLQ